MQVSSYKVRKLVMVALLAAISTVLMWIEVPIPGLPPFLKLDISSVPVMLGSFMFGPVAGISIALVKSLVHALSTQTAGVGELADFIITSSFALTAGIIYKFNRTKKGALIASVASIGVITVVGALANYFILLPFYAAAYMPMEAIIEMCQAINPNITDVKGYIIFGVVPFNLLKGTVVAVINYLLYKRLSGMIRRYTDAPSGHEAHAGQGK